MNKKQVIRLTESQFHKIVKECVNKLLNEGEEWIGGYNQKTYNQLVNKATQMNGKCSFSLNNIDFTMMPSQRGFTVSSGTEWRYESFSIESALKAAWGYSTKQYA